MGNNSERGGVGECDRCGARLDAEGFCPRCAAAGAMGWDPADIGGDTTVDAAQGVGDTTVDSPPGGGSGFGEGAGDVIGPYRLLQKIGEGGFGEVWMAEQSQPMRRRVALKIIKLGMDTKEVVARFEAERQALAMMDHPGIAKVFDAGATGSGRPYFAMELVRGEPITNFCDSERLDTRQRLELFEDVCYALGHAHQKGVIHRDIKPSNILVAFDDEGEPHVKVIDFGIAKATQQPLTDKTLFTRFEQFMGTPAYMSPEQAGLGPLEIDSRSDIYSLGVLLYELLAGLPPFDPRQLLDAGFETMRRIIREDDPPKPSTRLSTLDDGERKKIAASHRVEPQRLNKIVRGELDWVVMRALEKSRARRYQTANEFAQDVRRFLVGEPVAAAPPSLAYRTGKFVRRRRVLVSVASLLVVGIAGGLIAGWLLRDARAVDAAMVEASDFPLEIGMVDGREVLLEREHVEFEIRAPVDCFIALVSCPVDEDDPYADGVVLFPNIAQPDAFIAASDERIRIPGEHGGFKIEVGAPFGRERVYAVASRSEEGLRAAIGASYDRAKEVPHGQVGVQGQRRALFNVFESAVARDGSAQLGYGFVEFETRAK